MLNIADGQKVKVFEIEDKGNYSLVKMSSSRKDSRDGQYKYSSWAFTKFVGNAAKKASKLKSGMMIALKGAGISKEEYKDKDNNRAWPKSPQLVVFDFEFLDEQNKGIEDPRFEENHEDNDEMPF